MTDDKPLNVILSSLSNNDLVTLRGVAEGGELPPSATAVAEPTLEESYIGFMASRGRTSAARQDDETAPEAAENDAPDSESEETE